MEESILLSVKKLLGLNEENEEFDLDIILNINAAIQTLTQLGVGPKSGYIVTSKNDTYNDWLGDLIDSCPSIKMYLYYKTRLAFDPPTQQAIITVLKEMITETECRLSYQVDPDYTFD